MNSKNRPISWAIATLCLGIASAFPFLQKKPSQSPKPAPPPDSFASETGSSPSDLSAAHYFASDEGPATASLAPVDSRQLPSTSILAPALPEWAKPASPLDDMVKHGARSLANKDGAQELTQLPTWVNSNEQNTKLSSNTISSNEAPNGWHSTLHATPFDTQEPNGTAQIAARTELDWPDRDYKHWYDPSSPTPRESPSSVGNLASTVAKSNLHHSTADGPTKKQPADRRKRYVYQPGHQRPGDEN